jgi:hypothetical protein
MAAQANRHVPWPWWCAPAWAWLLLLTSTAAAQHTPGGATWSAQGDYLDKENGLPSHSGTHQGPSRPSAAAARATQHGVPTDMQFRLLLMPSSLVNNVI